MNKLNEYVYIYISMQLPLKLLAQVKIKFIFCNFQTKWEILRMPVV